MVIVKSGPSEKIMRKMKQPTKDLMAKGVGNVITTAAETNSMAQSRPEKCGPISEIMILHLKIEILHLKKLVKTLKIN